VEGYPIPASQEVLFEGAFLRPSMYDQLYSGLDLKQSSEGFSPAAAQQSTQDASGLEREEEVPEQVGEAPEQVGETGEQVGETGEEEIARTARENDDEDESDGPQDVPISAELTESPTALPLDSTPTAAEVTPETPVQSDAVQLGETPDVLSYPGVASPLVESSTESRGGEGRVEFVTLEGDVLQQATPIASVDSTGPSVALDAGAVEADDLSTSMTEQMSEEAAGGEKDEEKGGLPLDVPMVAPEPPSDASGDASALSTGRASSGALTSDEDDDDEDEAPGPADPCDLVAKAPEDPESPAQGKGDGLTHFPRPSVLRRTL
jgi:hypothetical protein